MNLFWKKKEMPVETPRGISTVFRRKEFYSYSSCGYYNKRFYWSQYTTNNRFVDIEDKKRLFECFDGEGKVEWVDQQDLRFPQPQ